MKKQLEEYLYSHIPISHAMGIQVELVSAQKVILSAPFAKNINHKKTVFGGSLHAVATLACWSLLHVNLQKTDDHNQIVITHSEVSYHLPVNSDFSVECSIPENSEWLQFLKMLKSKGKARINLGATIHQQGKLCVDYHGTFAALHIAGDL